MKIIFLDIDGVLNVYGRESDEFGYLFHKKFEDNLRWIISETDAKIVLTSSWRYAGIERIREMWIYRGLPGEVIDITIDCYLLVGEGKFEFYDEVNRGDEIQDWLDDHNSEIDSYVIIDDENDMLNHQRGNFVRTANNINHPDCEDIGYGLTKTCAERAIRILNNI